MHLYTIKPLAICAVALLMFPFNGLSQDHQIFENISPSIVIIETTTGAGSGFIINDDGTLYVLTNEHVLRGGNPRIRTLDGRSVRMLGLDIADDLDLARMRIEDQGFKGLTVAQTTPRMGERVFVFGNSDGQGVATLISGRIVGIGPDRVETDARFVQGNSGSPIVSSQGHVYAVATYATLNQNRNDWLKEGTRFNEVRRFGLRANNTKWVSFTWDEYIIRAQSLSDLATYVNDAFDLLLTERYMRRVSTSGVRSSVRLNYDVQTHRHKYKTSDRLSRVLSDTATSFNRLMSAADQAQSDIHTHSRSRGRTQRDNVERSFFFSQSGVRRHHDEFKRLMDNIYQTPTPMVLRSDWKTKAFHQEAHEWLEILKLITAFE